MSQKNRLLKAFSPNSYLRKLQQFWVHLNLRYNKQFIRTAQALNYQVHFLIDSWPEYDYRFRGSYTGEPTTVEWIDRYVGPDDVVYDIGANVGAYSLLAALKMKAVKGNGMIYAIEPEAGNFYKLNRNVQLNHVSEWILPVCIAIGNTGGVESFFLKSLELGSACHAMGSPTSEGQTFQPVHRQGILAYSLDEFVQKPGIRFPNHIKIDVDGLEAIVIKNSLMVLGNPVVRSVMIEINRSLSQGSIEDQLREAGFVEERRDEWNNIANVLYLRPAVSV